MKIRCIRAYTSQITTKDRRPNTPYTRLLYMKILEDIKCGPYSNKLQYTVSNTLDTPSLDNEDVLKEMETRNCENEFPAIVFNDTLISKVTQSCEPTVSSLNDEVDFKISFDNSDDEDYTIIFDKNSFSYKIISTNDLKTDSETDNEKVNMPSFPSPEPTVNCFNDLDFFKDFENEFPAIVYNDAPTSKSDLLTEQTLNPQHIDDFDLKDETSLSEYDEEEQNVLYFNDLVPFNIIQPDDLMSEKDNDDNEDLVNKNDDVGGESTIWKF
ncbi:hypothetical protein Tco_0816577 [Tanacetum coccineum]